MNARPQTTVSRRLLLGLGLAAAGTGALSACRGGPSNEPSGEGEAIEFMFWGEGDQNERLIDALDDFQAGDGAPKVTPQYSGLSGYYDKLATRLSGGNPPDVFQIHLPYLTEYIDRGAVLALDDYADELGLADLPDYIAPVSLIDGSYYFAILGAATQPAIIVNTTKLDDLGLKAPAEDWTLDDFVDTMTQVWETSGQTVHGCSDLGGSQIGLEAFLRGRGKALFADDGSLSVEEDDIQTWFQLWQDLRDSGAAVPMDVTASVDGFQTDPLTVGKSAFTLTATSRGLPSIQSLNTDTLALATFPSGGPGSASGTNIIPAGWFAISPKSGNIDGAVSMLSYLMSEPAAKTMGMARGVPIPPDIRETVAKSAEGLDAVVLENYALVESQDPAPLQPYPTGASRLLANDLPTINESIGFGESTVADGVTAFFAAADDALG